MDRCRVGSAIFFPDDASLKAPSYLRVVWAMLVAGFLPISFIGELISTGTLMAFATVCAALIRLRVTMPAHKRPFRVPLWQVIAPLGITASLLLLGSMGWAAIGRIVAWQVVGALVLFISLRARRGLTPR